MALQRVFEPIRIGNVEIASRVIRTAHDTGFDRGRIGGTSIDYHAERAQGGEETSIDTVLATFILCTVPDLERTLAQMRRALKPDGKLVFSNTGDHRTWRYSAGRIGSNRSGTRFSAAVTSVATCPRSSAGPDSGLIFSRRIIWRTRYAWRDTAIWASRAQGRSVRRRLRPIESMPERLQANACGSNATLLSLRKY